MVHFDIKGDNILLETMPGISEADFWSPPSSSPPFRVVFADFGESVVFSDLNAGTTLRQVSLQLLSTQNTRGHNKSF